MNNLAFHITKNKRYGRKLLSILERVITASGGKKATFL